MKDFAPQPQGGLGDLGGIVKTAESDVTVRQGGQKGNFDVFTWRLITAKRRWEADELFGMQGVAAAAGRIKMRIGQAVMHALHAGCIGMADIGDLYRGKAMGEEIDAV